MSVAINRRGFLRFVAAAPAILSGCSGKKTYRAYQLQELLVDAPQGPAVAKSVVELKITYRPEGLPMTNTYLTLRFKGQVPFMVLGERLLCTRFEHTHVMLGHLTDHFTPGALNPRRAKEFFDTLPDRIGAPPLDLPSQASRGYFVFQDRMKPSSIAQVSLGDLASTLGEGFTSVRFRVSFVPKSPPTTGLVEQLPWLRQAGSAPIGKIDQGEGGTNALAGKIYASDFVRPTRNL